MYLDKIATEADRLYEAVQEAENAATRLSEMLDAFRGGSDAAAWWDKTRRARSIQRQLFKMLASVERIYHENDGHEADRPLEPIVILALPSGETEVYGPFDESDVVDAIKALETANPNSEAFRGELIPPGAVPGEPVIP